MLARFDQAVGTFDTKLLDLEVGDGLVSFGAAFSVDVEFDLRATVHRGDLVERLLNGADISGEVFGLEARADWLIDSNELVCGRERGGDFVFTA